MANITILEALNRSLIATKKYVDDSISTIELTLGARGTADSVNWENVVGKPTFATVATSGSYNDLSNKPTIPTIPSSLPANGGNAATVGGYTIWTGTQAQYNAISNKSSTTIYFIKEG